MKISFFLFLPLYFILLSCDDNTVKKRNVDPTNRIQHHNKKENLNIKKKEIKFECISDCNQTCNTPSLKTKPPFNIVKQVRNDTTTVSFHFISDACQKYIEQITVMNDTIYLNYKSKSEYICECFHDYHYRFTLINYSDKVLFLKNKPI